MYLNTRQEFVSITVIVCLLSFAATVLFAIFLASPNPQASAQGSSSAEMPTSTNTSTPTSTATVFSCGSTSSDNHARSDDSFDVASLYPNLGVELQGLFELVMRTRGELDSPRVFYEIIVHFSGDDAELVKFLTDNTIHYSDRLKRYGHDALTAFYVPFKLLGPLSNVKRVTLVQWTGVSLPSEWQPWMQAPTPTSTPTAEPILGGAAKKYPKLDPILQMWLDKFDPNFPPGYTYAEIVTTGQFSRIVKLLNEGGYEHVIEGNSIFVFEVPILTLAYWSNFTEVVSILFNEWAGRSRQLDTQILESNESGLGISEDSVQMGTPYTVYAQVVNGVAQAGMKAKHAVQIEG